jgi:hypothetical protein
MALVLGIFKDEAQALQVIESLRGATFDTESLRLIGGTDNVSEFAAQAGASANIAAGPPSAVVGGLVESELSDDDLRTVEQRVQAGGVVLMAKGLDADAATAFAARLREHNAEGVISRDAAGDQG